MSNEYQLGGVTIVEDDSGNLKIKNIDSASVNALNNDEEPNLDISEFWDGVFSQGVSWTEFFNSVDLVSQETSGSGSVNANAFRVQLLTGSTDASHARIRKAPSPAGSLTWDKDRRWYGIIRPEDAQGKLFAGTGLVNEDDFTPEHMGFKWTGGNLVGSVADGSTEATTTLDSSPTTGSEIEVYLEYTSGTDVKFWIDKNPLTNAADGTISSNLPSGTSNANQYYCVHAENDSATAREIRVSRIEGAQMP